MANSIIVSVPSARPASRKTVATSTMMTASPQTLPAPGPVPEPPSGGALAVRQDDGKAADDRISALEQRKRPLDQKPALADDFQDGAAAVGVRQQIMADRLFVAGQREEMGGDGVAGERQSANAGHAFGGGARRFLEFRLRQFGIAAHQRYQAAHQEQTRVESLLDPGAGGGRMLRHRRDVLLGIAAAFRRVDQHDAAQNHGDTIAAASAGMSFCHQPRLMTRYRSTDLAFRTEEPHRTEAVIARSYASPLWNYPPEPPAGCSLPSDPV